jgi:hypothetical protein
MINYFNVISVVYLSLGYYFNKLSEAYIALWTYLVIIHPSPVQNDAPPAAADHSYIAEIGVKAFNIPIDGPMQFTDVASSPGGIAIIIILSGLFIYYVVIPATKASVSALSTPEPEPVVSISNMDKLVESLTANVNDIFHNLFI